MGVRVDILYRNWRTVKSGWLKSVVVLSSLGLVACGQHSNQNSTLPSPQANPYLESPDNRAPVFSPEQEKQFAQAAGLPAPVVQSPALSGPSGQTGDQSAVAATQSASDVGAEASETEVTVLSGKLNAPTSSSQNGDSEAKSAEAKDLSVKIVYGPKPESSLDVLHAATKPQPYDRQAEQQRDLDKLAQQRISRTEKSAAPPAAVKKTEGAAAPSTNNSGGTGKPKLENSSTDSSAKPEAAAQPKTDSAAAKSTTGKTQNLVPSKPVAAAPAASSSVKSKYLNMVGVPDSIKQNLLCEKISTAVRELEISQDEIMRSADLQVPEQLPVEYLRKIGEIIRRSGVNVSDTILRRDHFVCLMLPVIVKMDRVVFQKRLKVIELQQKQAQSQELTAVEQQWLTSLKTNFGLSASASFKDLLSRVDVVPVSLLLAQAALESDWGRYKWAVGNNLFGRHGIKTEACMFTASGVCLKKFASLEEGIGNQLYYLNTGRYEFAVNFRTARAKLREKGRPLDAGILADSLVGYASIGKEYARRLQALLNKQTFLEKYSFAEGEGRAGAVVGTESVDVNLN